MKNIKDFEEIDALQDVCPRCGQISDECICSTEDYYSTKNIYKLPPGKHFDFKKKKEEKPLPKPYGIEEMSKYPDHESSLHLDREVFFKNLSNYVLSYIEDNFDNVTLVHKEDMHGWNYRVPYNKDLDEEGNLFTLLKIRINGITVVFTSGFYLRSKHFFINFSMMKLPHRIEMDGTKCIYDGKISNSIINNEKINDKRFFDNLDIFKQEFIAFRDSFKFIDIFTNIDETKFINLFKKYDEEYDVKYTFKEIMTATQKKVVFLLCRIKKENFDYAFYIEANDNGDSIIINTCKDGIDISGIKKIIFTHEINKIDFNYDVLISIIENALDYVKEEDHLEFSYFTFFMDKTKLIEDKISSVFNTNSSDIIKDKCFIKTLDYSDLSIVYKSKSSQFPNIKYYPEAKEKSKGNYVLLIVGLLHDTPEHFYKLELSIDNKNEIILNIFYDDLIFIQSINTDVTLDMYNNKEFSKVLTLFNKSVLEGVKMIAQNASNNVDFNSNVDEN